MSFDNSFNSKGYQDESFEIEKVVAHKVMDGELMFLIKWNNWSEAFNTWNNYESLPNSNIALEEYIKENKINVENNNINSNEPINNEDEKQMNPLELLKEKKKSSN